MIVTGWVCVQAQGSDSNRVGRDHGHFGRGRRRYTQVDPDIRLVADAPEAEWNEALRALA
ncbi:hypothetical protein CJ010_10805 [Azoarcus sp. DD4]|nr:hypothetical protein CJ010_10805 [Azoarcus sp. DD4]